MTDLELLRLHFDGKSGSEIAGILGITRRAVQARIQRLRDPYGVRERDKRYYYNGKVKGILG